MALLHTFHLQLKVADGVKHSDFLRHFSSCYLLHLWSLIALYESFILKLFYACFPNFFVLFPAKFLRFFFTFSRQIFALFFLSNFCTPPPILDAFYCFLKPFFTLFGSNNLYSGLWNRKSERNWIFGNFFKQELFFVS